MHDYILRFDVPVNNPISMQLLHSRTNLLHVTSRLDLSHRLTSLQLLIQLAIQSHLQHNVYVIFVVETSIHFDNVWMTQEHLNLHLADELIHYLLLF